MTAQTPHPGNTPRRRRSNVPEEEVGATLRLTDADPNSDFVVTKIEFKERYGDKEETHVVDFERKTFFQDSGKSGSKLSAEFEINGEVIPVIEDVNKVVTYKIVLRPKGN